MAYYKSLREYLKALDKAGKLVTITSPVNKDTQLVPLVYLQWRGLPPAQWKAFLFTNVFDSRGRKYDIPVAYAPFGFYDVGLKCSRDEVLEKAAQAVMHPIEPKLVKHGPVQEVVYMGKRLLEKGGLDELPVPIRHPGWDAGPINPASCWVTKDIETGARNVGVYRCSTFAPTRAGIHIGGVHSDIATHWQKCRARGIPLQAAVVIGGPPNLTYVGPVRLPYGVDEYGVAGGIAGAPVELVKCKTVDLEVPAHADIVIEGELSTAERMIEGPHGEVCGLESMGDLQPYLTVTCVTHRKDAIWTGPAESPLFTGLLYKRLRYDLNMPYVLAVGAPIIKAPGAEGFSTTILTAIKIKAGTAQKDVWRTLEEAGHRGGITVAVDEHIDVRNPDMVLWSIASKSQPHLDNRIYEFTDLHPLHSSYMPEPLSQGMRRNQFHPAAGMPGDPGVPGGSGLLINATQKWPYPPLNLPKKEFMEEALGIWEKEGLGKLDLASPWHGCELGYWPKEFAEDADRAVKGEYYETYERRFRERVTNEDLPPGDYHAFRDRWQKYPQS